MNYCAVLVRKASGERETFSEEKLRTSLLRSGASPELAEEIVGHVGNEAPHETTTAAIYAHAFSILRSKKPAAAARYSLRQAIRELGPSGFPFERFVAEILKVQGYAVSVGGILPGFCVPHEVDIVAERAGKHIFVECKFHQDPHIKSDLKVALYVRARFDDITKAHEKRALGEGRAPRIHEGWLVTNTKLTSQAIRYGACAGLTLIGWNYPTKGNLQDLILDANVHPLTCLPSLGAGARSMLMQDGVVLCRDLTNDRSMLEKLGMSRKDIDCVLAEAQELCVPGAAA